MAEAQVLRGAWSVVGREQVTVQEWSERWLASPAPHLKRTTAAHYESLLRLAILPMFGDRDVRRLRPIEVGEWVSKLSRTGKSPSWVRKSHQLLSQMMSAAVDNELIAASPCRGHRLPRLPAPDPQILTVDEVERLIAASRGSGRLLAQLLAYAGARIGEVLPLRRNDVSPDGKVLRVDERQVELSGYLDYDEPKAHQHRFVTLPSFLADLVHDHLAADIGPEPEALLFTGHRTICALRMPPGWPIRMA